MSLEPNLTVFQKPRFKKGDIVLSKSQFESYFACKRLWWFEKVIKVPDIPTDRQAFGTVTHAVLERYLKSDKLDRDVSGRPAELYPLDWDVAEDKWGSGPKIRITPEECSLIQQLVEVLISEGHIVKEDDMLIEQEFYIPIAPGIYIMGYMDVFKRHLIEDHKTTSNLKWALSEAKLQKDVGALTYALANFVIFPDDDEITIKYNYIQKDPNNPSIKIVATSITQDMVQEFVELIEENLDDIRKLKTEKEITSWANIEGPEKRNTCNRYGGCPMMGICHNGKKPKDFLTQRATAINNANMSLESPAIRFIEVKHAPWSVPNCEACSDNAIPGFSKKGTPCRICNSKVGYPSEYYSIVRENGKILISSRQLKINQVILLEQKKVSTKTSSIFKSLKKRKISVPADAEPELQEEEEEELEEEVQESPLKKKFVFGKKTEKQLVVEEAKVVEEDVADEDTEPVKIKKKKVEPEEEPEVRVKKVGKKRGRPPLKVVTTLCINCIPSNSRKIVHVETLFMEYGKTLASEHKVDTYYHIPAFDRRDALASMSDRIMEEYKGHTLVCTSDSPDIVAFRDALVGHADNVIRGI
jgi:hypothetical protein|tara:strand:+ start:3236 stop:4990 length:1755 start_codon:yes stop_codon:yes gene_type:complete